MHYNQYATELQQYFSTIRKLRILYEFWLIRADPAHGNKHKLGISSCWFDIHSRASSAAISKSSVVGYSRFLNFLCPGYYGHDHLFSVAVLFDDTGDVEERCEYDAYGKAVILESDFDIRASSLYNNPYLFTGRRLDILDGGSFKIQYVNW